MSRPFNVRPILAILVITMLGVGLACAGEKATPTSPPTATTAPTATATTAPTATLVPTATATLVPGAPTPTATAIPMATATAVPEPSATAVPLTWIQKYMQSPGYKPEWGKPQTGGTLKMGMHAGPTAFIPNEGASYNGTWNVPPYNTLIRFDTWVGLDAKSIIGDLAKSWEFSSDNLHLTLKLEEGVKFQNNPNIPERLRNADFTCEDVQASVERHIRAPAAEKVTVGKVMLSHLNGVSCPDGALGYTAVLNFDMPKAKTLASLSTGHLVMMDKDFIEWLHTEKAGALTKTAPVNYLLHTGTGPFVTVEFQPDVIGKMRRNPSYFREGLPLVDAFDLIILKDYTTRFTALATGQIHIFGTGSSSMLPGQVAQAERDFKDRIVLNGAAHVYGYGVHFNMSRAPYNDLRVRKAISLAIDRDDWLAFEQSGSYPGSTLMGILPPDTYWSYTQAELRTWPGIRQPKDQDVAEANRLLDEVFGKGKRFSTKCTANNTQSNMDYCLFFGDQMKRHLNVDVVMDFAEAAVNTEKKESGRWDMAYSTLGAVTSGDPDETFLRTYHREYAGSATDQLLMAAAAANDPVLQTALEALMVAQSDEVDPVKRREMTRELDYRLTNEAYYFASYGWLIVFHGTTPNLKGYNFYDYPVQSYWSLYERVWLAK